jgi:hypothetical protein
MLFPELARRMETRLRDVLIRSLGKERLRLQEEKEEGLQYDGRGHTPYSMNIQSDDITLLRALLRRATIMQRLPSLQSVILEEDIFQREMANAKRDLTTRTLPSLTSSSQKVSDHASSS